MSITYTLKIVDIIQETDDTITLCFKQPALKKIQYVAGQYLTLIVRINGRRYIRPYSFSSCYGVDRNIEVTIKRVPNGIVSNYIIDMINIGDSIEVLPPMGDFILGVSPKQKNIFLWGTGSGITPLISITKSALYQFDDLKVHLIYGNKNFESTIFLEKIESLKEEFPERFNRTYFHTRFEIDKNFPYVIEGRIQERRVNSIIDSHIKEDEQLHYICGPVGLKESLKMAFKSLNINERNIFSEDFEILRNPSDFDDISTQTISLYFQGRNEILEVVKGQSILEAALNVGLELPYSCQTGNCSTCKATLLSGGIKMIGLTKEREDLNEQEYLLCCSHPKDNIVSIKI
ncbi:ferredoxin--NADP reductase [Chryseobacterium sp. RG1]|uniref:Ferredoxin--NADP reductase n=1 Tax=Chryseobacterium tagetis TaxID=2801334 RepID=A0ABS8A536_9FLAO|nr:ferredoxin--NADP reductase [Chryseobacterium tagetis]MCA6069096.1 ferredoxin--NADP reductase [Chryseobacterium tagetis]